MEKVSYTLASIQVSIRSAFSIFIERIKEQYDFRLNAFIISFIIIWNIIKFLFIFGINSTFDFISGMLECSFLLYMIYFGVRDRKHGLFFTGAFTLWCQYLFYESYLDAGDGWRLDLYLFVLVIIIRTFIFSFFILLIPVLFFTAKKYGLSFYNIEKMLYRMGFRRKNLPSITLFTLLFTFVSHIFYNSTLLLHFVALGTVFFTPTIDFIWNYIGIEAFSFYMLSFLFIILRVVCEEIFFRSFLQKSLYNFVSHKLAIVIVSFLITFTQFCILFGIFYGNAIYRLEHHFYNLPIFFSVSITASYLFYRTDNIVSTMLFRLMWQGFNLSFLFIVIPETTSYVSMVFIQAANSCLFLIFSLTIIYYVSEYFGWRGHRYVPDTSNIFNMKSFKRKAKSFLKTAPGIVIAFLFVMYSVLMPVAAFYYGIQQESKLVFGAFIEFREYEYYSGGEEFSLGRNEDIIINLIMPENSTGIRINVKSHDNTVGRQLDRIIINVEYLGINGYYKKTVSLFAGSSRIIPIGLNNMPRDTYKYVENLDELEAILDSYRTIQGEGIWKITIERERSGIAPSHDISIFTQYASYQASVTWVGGISP